MSVIGDDCSPSVCIMGGSRGGGDRGSGFPLGNHKWLAVFLKILVLTSLEEAIGSIYPGSNCFLREVRNEQLRLLKKRQDSHDGISWIGA